ncbi:MAG: hypothetical protein BGO98_08295 [Myxococcales bacterium 68-20]|nr:MAG: hypothetical protein BGO98_08295 [Myxococcales bacterium 68-20]
MPMTFSYRLIRDKSGFVAECVESEAAGEGKTAKDAVDALRRSLEERMFRPDAVAPPSHPAEETIELVLADESSSGERRSLDLGGPGDAR